MHSKIGLWQLAEELANMNNSIGLWNPLSDRLPAQQRDSHDMFVKPMHSSGSDVKALPHADFPYYYGVNDEMLDINRPPENMPRRAVKNEGYADKSIRQTPREFFEGFDPQSFMV